MCVNLKLKCQIKSLKMFNKRYEIDVGNASTVEHNTEKNSH